MIGKLKNLIKSENGAAQIVEASIVFPVMFIVLIFLIYLGNAYFIQSHINAIVIEKAVKGAAYCADPMLETIKEDGGIPSVKDLELEPYRYILGGMNDIENKIAGEVYTEIENSKATLFKNMKPDIVTPKTKIAKFNNHLLYSTFSVEVECEINFPIKFLGQSTPPMITVSCCSDVAVNDCGEFIRNVDMVIDYFVGSEAANRVKDIFDKINDFISMFAEK